MRHEIKFFMHGFLHLMFKVQVFREGHKNLLSKRQNHEEDCTNLCGLLRKAELYEEKVSLHFTDCTKFIQQSLIKPEKMNEQHGFHLSDINRCEKEERQKIECLDEKQTFCT